MVGRRLAGCRAWHCLPLPRALPGVRRVVKILDYVFWGLVLAAAFFGPALRGVALRLGVVVKIADFDFWALDSRRLHLFGPAAAAAQQKGQDTDYADTGPGCAPSVWRRVFGVRPDPASAFEGSAARGLGGAARLGRPLVPRPARGTALGAFDAQRSAPAWGDVGGLQKKTEKWSPPLCCIPRFPPQPMCVLISSGRAADSFFFHNATRRGCSRSGSM